jgi:hypothetical protein
LFELSPLFRLRSWAVEGEAKVEIKLNLIRVDILSRRYSLVVNISFYLRLF